VQELVVEVKIYGKISLVSIDLAIVIRCDILDVTVPTGPKQAH
jgi:hypothetical protein